MWTRRVTAPGASVVWIVESTRCPVMAAAMAISAVSRSRISPTMTTSGSCRRTERRAVGKESPDRGSTSTWATPGRRYSTGSSKVTTFRTSRSSSARAPKRVLLFPEPVGPAARITP